MRAAPTILLAAMLAVGPAAAARDKDDATRLARELAGRTAGPAERCVSSGRVGTATIYGDSLVYRDGRTLWVNRIDACPSLSGDPILVVELFGDQMCENDRFRTVPRGGIAIPGPYCRFGKFTPYRAPR